MKLRMILALLLPLFFLGCTGSLEKKQFDSEIHFEIAKEYLNAGQMGKALKEAETAIELFERNLPAHFLKAETLARLEKFDGAFTVLNQLEPIISKSDRYLLDHWKAVIYYHKKDLKKAVELFELSAKKEPNFALNYKILSDIYPKIGLLEKAVNRATRWTELQSGSGQAWESLAVILTRNENYPEAKEALDKALAINPKSAMAYNYYGRWADEQKIWDMAEQSYLKSISLDKENPYVYLSLGQLMMITGRLDDAFPYLEKSNQMNAENEFTHFWFGEYYLKKGNYEKAFEHFGKSFKINPAFSKARAGFADASMQSSSNYAEAVKVLNDGVKKAPAEKPSYYYYLAKVHYAKGDLEASIEFTEKAMAMLDQSAVEGLVDLHLLKGNILSKKGNKKEARKEYETTVKLSPDSESGKKAKKLLKN